MIRVPDLRWGGKLALAVASFLLALLAAEVGLRPLIRPSKLSSGTLFGHELPPLAVVPEHPPSAVDRSVPFGDLVVDGDSVTVGDLNGAYREHPVLGHVPLESWSSKNGWWVNDELGAREDPSARTTALEGRTRVLLFGDSFAAGFGLAQEEVASRVLQEHRPDLRVSNFGVPGYGMGQAVLRFEELRERVDYDIAMLLFVPGVDLWRDLNVMRHLGEGGWSDYDVVPRFEVEGGELRLVPRLYEHKAELFRENAGGSSPRLREHLLAHDRFYFPAKYERRSPWDRSIFYKLWVKLRYDGRRRELHRTVVSADSEALRVSDALFRRMDELTRADGARFVLLVLPSHRDLWKLGDHPDYAEDWRRMTETIAAHRFPCIDMSAEFRGLAPEDLDFAHDGTHYGPRANARMAAAIQRGLTRWELVEDAPN